MLDNLTEFVIVDDYPIGAAHGCDFFTHNDKGKITVDTADGPVVRDERVVITPYLLDGDYDHDGIICIGERSARVLAHKFGMVDGWRVEIVNADNLALRAELVAMSNLLASERARSGLLAQIETPDTEPVYIAIDGTKHANLRASQERTASVLDLEPAIVQDAAAAASPIPAPNLETSPR